MQTDTALPPAGGCPAPERGPDAFRALHHADRPLLLPNAWDYASAAALVAAGFAAVGTTSLGVAAAHGLPDARGRARAETLALTRLLGRLPCLLTVDLEAGFSADPGEVAELAAEVAAAGAVGINLEDSIDGALVAPGRQQETLAAVKAREPGLFVNARIDTYWLAAVGAGPGRGRPPLAGTLARAEAYLAAGADGIFVPGLTGEAEIGALVAAVDAPVNVLFAPGRHTVSRLADLGVRRISSGSLLFRTALHAAVETALALRREEEPDLAAVPGYAETARLITPP